MTDLDKLRAFAQGYIDEADGAVSVTGTAGADRELAQAEVARKLLALLDEMTARPAP